MTITGRIFNPALPRGSQGQDIRLDFDGDGKQITNQIMHQDILKLIQTWTDEAAFDDNLADDGPATIIEKAIAKARAGARRACVDQLKAAIEAANGY